MAASQLGYTPGSGANVATDLDGGIHHQKTVMEYLTGAGGVPTPVTDQAPLPTALYGEAIEALEAMRMAIQALTRTMGQAMPDTAGRLRVNVELGALTASIAAAQTLATLTNQTQIGGLSATEQIPSLMRLGADSLRRNITVT
jgi:hypothetical protein